MENSVVCKNIFEAIRSFEPAHPILQVEDHGGVMVHMQRFDAVGLGGGQVAELSLSPNLFTYYRGENGRYASCKPNIYRHTDMNLRILWEIKRRDFELFLQKTSQMQRRKAVGLVVDYKAISQHYGFPTDMLDIAQDIVVAAFFATHKYDPYYGVFRPMTKGIGRLRRYVDPGIGDHSRLRIFGNQLFARPGAQSGYGLVMEESEDFSDMSCLVEFIQDEKMNDLLDQSFQGNGMFFPEEPLAVVARTIQNTPLVTNEAIRKYCDESGAKEEAIDQMLTEREILRADIPLFYPALG